MIMDMEDAEDPDDANACFVGCLLQQDNLISETGQLNKATAENKLKAIEDVEENAFMTDFFDDLAEDLADAKDICSGGEIAQRNLYYLKFMKAQNEEEDALEQDVADGDFDEHEEHDGEGDDHDEHDEHDDHNGGDDEEDNEGHDEHDENDDEDNDEE